MSSRLPIILSCVAITFAIAAAVFCGWAIRDQQHLVNQLNDQVAKIQPYAFSRTELDSLLSRRREESAPASTPVPRHRRYRARAKASRSPATVAMATPPLNSA